jgi:uncharacterized protein YigA (DUF484 family)
MSRSDEPNPLVSTDEEDHVVAYLRQHPDLLRRRAALLPALDIPHVSGGAISLIERQVRLLREQNLALQARLEELLTLARHNELIDDRLHRLTLMLIGHPDLATTLQALCQGLRDQFEAEQLVVVLYQGSPVTVEGVRWIASDRLTTICDVAMSTQPCCGNFAHAQLVDLFAERAAEIASAALIPLGVRGELGLIAIGSQQSERFTPHMGALFLRRIGELTTTLLSRYQPP